MKDIYFSVELFCSIIERNKKATLKAFDELDKLKVGFNIQNVIANKAEVFRDKNKYPSIEYINDYIKRVYKSACPIKELFYHNDPSLAV